MRLTQGCFSFLPDLTDQQIEKQVTYAMSRGLAMNVEWTDDPHPRNNYWELWGLPLLVDPPCPLYMFHLLPEYIHSFLVWQWSFWLQSLL